MIHEKRGCDFQAELEDLTPAQEPEGTEKREIDYSIYEKTVELLKIKRSG